MCACSQPHFQDTELYMFMESLALLCLLQVEKSKPFKCGTFGASSLQNKHLATGDFDGKLNIW